MPEKLNIEQMIKIRLGEAEITPSPKSWTRIHHKLRRAKFFRFNPDRFNIFYLSGLLVVIATVSIISILSDSDTVNSREYIATDQLAVQEYDSPQREQDLFNGKQYPDNEIKKGKLSVEESEHQEKASSSVEKKSETANNVSTLSQPEASTRKSVPGTLKSVPGAQSPELKNDNLTTPVTFFTTSVQSGCAPLELEIYNESLNAITLNWDFGDGSKQIQSLNNDQSGYQNSGNLTHKYSDPGTYVISLTATGSSSLSSSYRLNIEVHPKPVADFDYQKIIGEDTKVELLNYSIDASTYSWRILNPEPGILNPEPFSIEFQPTLASDMISKTIEHSDAGTVNLVLIASNFFGCTDTIEKQLPIVDREVYSELSFPNAFSPSPTGPTGGYYSANEINNAIFHPKFSEEPAIYNLKIYSRTGEMIFESNDIHIGWDGYRFDAQSSSGVYIWKATGKWKNGESFEQSGDVTLIWKK